MVEWIVSSSVLIAVIVLLRSALKGRISLRLQYALWALVLVRLLLPVSIGSSSISVMNQVERSAIYQETAQAVTKIQVPFDSIRDSESTYGEAEQAGNRTPHPAEGYPSDGEKGDLHTHSYWASLQAVGAQILRILWICGIALVGVWFAISNLRLMHSLKKTRTLLAGDHELPVYLSGAIDTPCLFGLFRPAIYLTGEAASDSQAMRHAVEHELTHYHHRDNIWAILRGVCLAIHWFNPLVWCAAVFSRNDAELACDESTILRLGESERAAYGRTLISLTCEKRPALLNTATTMTGSGRSIKERISLIVRKPKMAGYTLALVILIAAFSVGCTFTGAPDASDGPGESDSKLTGQYASVEDYITQEAEGKNTVSLAVWETPYAALADGPIEATVVDRKLEFLAHYGSLEGLAPNGTLEAWVYDWLIKTDPAEIDPDSIVLTDGMGIDADGYIDLGIQKIVVALRYPDGSYDILGEEPHGDGSDFFGNHHNTEESLYDWYVTKNDLELPLYVEDWIDRVTVPEGGSLGSFPVHRYDGDGWYIYYASVNAWTMQEPSKDHWEWYSAYDTASMLVVDRFTRSLEEEYAASQEQGFAPLDDTKKIWSREQGGINERYYFYPAEDGSGCWRVWTLWTDEGITDYPYIAMEPEVLHLMAESFTVDQRMRQTAIAVVVNQDVPDAVVDYAMDYVRRQIDYHNEMGGDPPEGAGSYAIINANIRRIEQVVTGTAGLDDGVALYLLEYRLQPDHPENVPMAGGMTMDDGWLTEWGSAGQPYLLLHYEGSGDETVWTPICVTSTDIIEVDYGTPEMLERYGNKYTAAAMELYARYLSDDGVDADAERER